MKKYPKVVQVDARGQIVIPKDIRNELGLEDGSGFYVFSVQKEGILLKKIDVPELNEEDNMLREIDEKADKIGVKRSNIKSTIKNYKKTKIGKLDVI